jgi:hypothetical protein
VLDEASKSAGRTGLRDDLVITPAGGASKLFPLASILLGHSVEVAALLDGDEPGRREGAKLKDKLLSDKPNRCLFLGDILGIDHAEIEHLFPEAWVVEAANTAYGVTLAFTDDEKKIASVVERIDTALRRGGAPRLEKWRTGAVLRDRVLNAASVPSDILDRAEKVFHALNGAFAT